MVDNVVTIGPEATIFEIEKVLSKKHFHALPVVDDLRTLLGIVTQYDLFVDDGDEVEYLPVYIEKLRRIAERKDAPAAIREGMRKFINMRASDIMSPKCLTLSPDSEVKEAILIFQKTNFASIPIVDGDKRLVGLVTIRDVLKNVPEDTNVF